MNKKILTVVAPIRSADIILFKNILSGLYQGAAIIRCGHYFQGQSLVTFCNSLVEIVNVLQLNIHYTCIIYEQKAVCLHLWLFVYILDSHWCINYEQKVVWLHLQLFVYILDRHINANAVLYQGADIIRGGYYSLTMVKKCGLYQGAAFI